VNPETFNLELRKFLKTFGVTAQRDIEHAVESAIGAKRLTGSETLKARATLEITGLGRVTLVEGDIALGA
jgi:hypothetical protein